MPTVTEKRSRGRPRQFDRDAALRIALELFLERGYAGASVSDVTDAMGISPPSLYAAFGSKESLYREALALYVEGRGRFVSRALEHDAPVEQQVRQILHDAAVAFTPIGANAPGCMVSADLLMFTPDNAGVAEHVRTLRAAPVDAVARRIEVAKKNGELPATANGKTLARFYAAVVTGMAIQARDGARRKDLLEVAENAMQAWPRPAARKR
jgi:TetR/AcrR family transcriptional regulator, copper-responsive repressor